MYICISICIQNVLLTVSFQQARHVDDQLSNSQQNGLETTI